MIIRERRIVGPHLASRRSNLSKVVFMAARNAIVPHSAMINPARAADILTISAFVEKRPYLRTVWANRIRTITKLERHLKVKLN
jgi:hypothetical protein